MKKIDLPLEQRLRLALEELGPCFIKLGQIIGTRRDLLPQKFNDELQYLKDNVKSEFIDVDAELGVHKDQFEYINYQPIAAASVAQVYDAKLKDGNEVVIKILRPTASRIIQEDLELFSQLLDNNFIISNYKANIFKRILVELKDSLMQEIDFVKEKNNAETFRENLKDFDNVLIPKIYHDYCSSSCIVMEKMYGTPVDKVDALNNKGLDLRKVAEEGLEILMIQILRNRFFHADLHSGNIWITDTGKRVYLDFGIMGTLTKGDRDLLADMMVNLYLKKYDIFMTAMINAGWLPLEIDKEKFVETIKEINLNKSAAQSLNEIFLSAEKFGIVVPTQFTLLAKTLMVTEANGRILYPNMNLGLWGSSILLKHFKEHIKYEKE